MIGIATDVTAHREAVAALVGSELRYRSIVDFADEGIWTLDGEGRTTFVNARLAEMLGTDPDAVLGLTVDELVHGADLSSEEDVRVERRDGTELWVMFRTAPVVAADGTSRGTVTMVTDVTARRQAADELHLAVEQLQEADRVRTDFVSTVSHELRTPLTSIVGYLELLTEGDAGPLAPQQERMLAVVERNSRRLLALIEDLLTLSRVESGSFKLGRQLVDIGPLVEGAEAAILPALRAKGIHFDVSVDPDVGCVMGDAAQLERVLLNLLSNAAKFTDEGGSIAVRAEGRGGTVRLTVSDTGMGIPAEEQAKLFTRFFRSSLAHEHAIQGTGLGLAIVKTIVEQHAGTVDLDSTPGQGTTFTIVLPASTVMAGSPA
jgi:PAS domain S-box-containing protein